MGQGLRGLVGGVAAGVTGVVRAPLQGYNDGTGLVAGRSQAIACFNHISLSFVSPPPSV